MIIAGLLRKISPSRKRKRTHANEKDQLQAKIDAMQK